MSIFSLFRLALLFILLFNGIPLLGQPRIIFDTDIGSDCDDAGAMAVLHKLADKGEIDLLGVIFSSNANVHGAAVCQIINGYYGRPSLPTGQYRGTARIGDKRDGYLSYLATTPDHNTHSQPDSLSELVAAYKKLLAEQPDASTTIITVGHPVGLFYLINDKEGMKLVKEKVISWIAMTHTDTIPQNDWNFGKNGTALYLSGLLKAWPSKVYFSGAGKKVITGNKKLQHTPLHNPVRISYERWGNNALKNGRSSWDQIAVLFAARPSFFDVEKGLLTQNDQLETSWSTQSNHDRHYKITPNIPVPQLESIIEDLMSEAPVK